MAEPPGPAPDAGANARRSWADAHRALSAVGHDALAGADLERLAVAAYLTGHDDESAAAWEGAHRRHLDAGDVEAAARCSFWLALCLMVGGQHARASGWLRRTEDVLAAAAEPDRECAATGYLLIPQGLAVLDDAPGAALELAVRAGEIGRRVGDADLHALGVLLQGQALIGLGDTVAGTARLDDVMLSVTADDVGPIAAGIVYCAVILECVRLFDFPRASEWTEALGAWCEAQPDLVPYRGQCLVHRAQVQQATGAWPDAVVTAASACRYLADPPHPALGSAYYQAAELDRLRGAFDEASAKYRDAIRHGDPAVPGLALLELARGDTAAADAAIRRALAEVANPVDRPALLAAAVDIARAVHDVGAARTAADELTRIADASASATLHAMAAQAAGAVALAEGDPSGALVHLRSAATGWHRLNMPYERARATVLIAEACDALGDRASATMERASARETFAALGARPDLERLASLAAPNPSGDRALSAREREVLAHVAAGKTNREIADALTISQHTVGRHL